MKKILAAFVTILASAIMAVAWIDPSSTGTVIGNGFIGSNCYHCIAIGGGTDDSTNATGLAYVCPGSSNCVQIGGGSNYTANTIHYGTLGFLSVTNTAPWDAAQILAGSSITAINGTAITNLTAANIRVGGTFLQQNGSALTALNPAAITAGTVTGLVLDATSTVPAATVQAGTIAGAIAFTAIPRLNAGIGTQGTVTGLITNAPAGMSPTAKWLKIMSPDGTTNYFAAYQF